MVSNAEILADLAGYAGARTEANRVTLWHQKQGSERAFFEESVRRYNAEHSDHPVEALKFDNEELRTQFEIAALSGKGPDLIYGPADNVGHLVINKTLRPLDDVFPAEFFDEFAAGGFVTWEGSK